MHVYQYNLGGSLSYISTKKEEGRIRRYCCCGTFDTVLLLFAFVIDGQAVIWFYKNR